ncbi:hypothetical protein [Corynebacterium sp.]|uniref:phage tail tube protein n=1 Tax=Corynebacterium sp. TaxID=1720 RepID=UPI0025C28D8C|nr:hypothetical protein [Corynebacterium sp.]
MAINVKNAFVGSPAIDGGVLFRAPLGTALPTDSTTAIDRDVWEDHGAVSEDGVSVVQDRSTSDIKAYGGDTFITVQDNYDEQIEITLLEDDNDAVLRSAFGEAFVEKTEATSAEGTKRTIYHTSQPLPISSFVVHSVYGDKTKRYVIERGQVVSVGDTVDVHSDVTKKTLTIKTYKPADEALKGGNVVEYRNDGEANAGAGTDPENP